MLMIKTERSLPQTQRELEGETAIVTGSTSGIGLGIARVLAQRGANVVLNGFGDAGEIEIVRAALAMEHNVEITYDGADMSKPEAIARMIEGAAAHFGRVDILVNNAGIQHVAPIEEFPPAKWDAILAINLSAAFHTTRAVFAGMRARRWDRIINIASAHALIASPYKSAYVAAKHGVLGLTKVTALEGAEHGITCNAICPGYVWTPLVEKQIDDRPAATASRASRSSATCCWSTSRRRNSPRSRRSAGLQPSSAPTPRLPSPAQRCRWTAAGPPIDRQGASRHGQHDIH
jgi:3-hydroxybutyrate dehydrogenase